MNKKKLQNFVQQFLDRKGRFFDVSKKFGSPLYIIDEEALVNKLTTFRRAFESTFDNVQPFYAAKSNYHPFLLKTSVAHGYGIDVSSGWELQKALQANPKEIIFSGPAKTHEELDLACRNAKKTIVLCDSFGELKRLNEMARHRKVKIRAGVRLMIEEKGLWRKFGIPLDDLPRFYKESKKYSNVNFCGLEFHASWNMNPDKQIAFIKRLARKMSALGSQFCQQMQFLDIGGGYWPIQGEWLQPSATPEGELEQCINPKLTEGMKHYCIPAVPIEEFANKLSIVLHQYILNQIPQARIFLEPGRWICHDSMHILLRVVDKKAKDVVITDGGTNIVGYERYESDYFPVINLSRPSLKESPCMVFGSLCNPHDIWGYNYFGKSIEPDDLLLIPTQGAYTYSLRQEFIKPLPPQIILSKNRFQMWTNR